MRAFICSRISDDLSGVALGEAEAPRPGPGEALVRVRAAGVNFPDLLICQGKYQLKPATPFIPGMDIAGDVVALGEGADASTVGEAVVGGVRLGGFAEYAVAPITTLAPKPAALDYAHAAAFPAAYLTAYVALVRRARLEAGETLLVHGAAGGVGLATVDLGKILGARVIATASTSEKRDFLTRYGADAVLPASGFRDAVKEMTDGRGADVIFDPVGGDVFDESVRAIAFDGRLLVIGFAGGRIPTLAANMALIKGFSVLGVRAGEYGRQFPDKGRENIAAIHKLAAEGRVRPHVCAEFPLAETMAALDMLRSRRAIGKIIVRPDL